MLLTALLIEHTYMRVDYANAQRAKSEFRRSATLEVRKNFRVHDASDTFATFSQQDLLPNKLIVAFVSDRYPQGDCEEMRGLLEQCCQAIAGAHVYSASTMKGDNHWSGEVRSNVTITAEYVFLWTWLDIDLSPHREDLKEFFFNQQRQEGSWSIDLEHPGDVSLTTEAYLALKILGVDHDLPMMRAARDFILSKGGIPSIRFFTRIYLAMFGLLPWSSIPQLPPELILLPKSSAFSIYRFASWARSTLVPLIVIAHYKPVFALPNGRSARNHYLAEFWQGCEQEDVPYAPPFIDMFRQRNWIGIGAKIADGLTCYGSYLGIFSLVGLRPYAVQKCMEWILARQEPSGDWAGIFPPLHACTVAMYLSGIPKEDPRMLRALRAIQRFGIRDGQGLRFQPCVSAGWDTALMTIGLLESYQASDQNAASVMSMLNNAITWMTCRQTLGCVGDWRVYRPFINSGGFAFEYHNSWYPDIDDTQTVVLAMIKADPEAISSDCVVAAVEWMLGMQNSNGGWAGFDVNNANLYLNDIPFSDMDAFCDPATADVTGGVVEAMALMIRIGESKSHKSPALAVLLRRMKAACERALAFLIFEQEPNGSWWGRWGCNRLYGTTSVLSGLEYFHGRKGYNFLDLAIENGLSFLKDCQNADGGWGESTLSYNSSQEHGNSFARGQSTPSQTAWVVSTLLAYCPASDPHAVAGIAFLIDTQTQDGHGGLVNGSAVGERMGRSWLEHGYTATGFPGHMMLGYEFYSHYFPLMALGRWRSKAQRETNI